MGIFFLKVFLIGVVFWAATVTTKHTVEHMYSSQTFVVDKKSQFHRWINWFILGSCVVILVSIIGFILFVGTKAPWEI